MGSRRTTDAAGWTTAAAVVALLMLWLVPAQSAAAKHKGLKIDVLSTRADLISGGEALVAIRGAHSLRGLKVKAAGSRQTKRFQLVDGTPEGVVKGLARGRSRIVVRQGRKGARLRVTNHPSGGPVFSGPQLQPWRCQEGATDSECDQPPTYSYLYMLDERASWSPRSQRPALGRRDDDNRPGRRRCRSSSASRQGYQDRDQYKIAALFQPGKPWTACRAAAAVQPQAADHPRRRRCGVEYQTGDGAPASPTGTAVAALGRGFATMSTALDNSGHNCNIAVQAESLVMAKEHLIEQLRDAPLHDRRGLLGRLARRAVDLQRLPRHLPGDPAELLVPRRLVDGDAVPRLPPDAALLQEPDSVGRRAWRGRQRRWRTSRAVLRRRERAGLRRRSVPRRRSRPIHAPGSRDAAALRPDDQPRRRALHDPGRCDQRLRTAAAVGAGRRRSSRSATGSPAPRSTTSACSTGSAPCRQARSRRPSSST